MKFFAFIMAFLMLGLSGLPCRDGAVANAAKTSVSHDIAGHEDGHRDGTHQDFCSPLCICSCCSVVTQYNPSPSVEIVSFENHIQHLSFYSGSLISISLPIWQPPQLVA
ncbi:MAG: hypothetical protein JNL51_11620 [Chitinophagaceae bacterium]|nr:hypothetical protein [Chitinophagaceae bacterium]